MPLSLSERENATFATLCPYLSVPVPHYGSSRVLYRLFKPISLRTLHPSTYIQHTTSMGQEWILANLDKRQKANWGKFGDFWGGSLAFLDNFLCYRPVYLADLEDVRLPAL